MENLWAVSMGRQFFCMSTVGWPNKNTCMSTSKNKDINNKNKQNYPNYQMQMMLLKPVLCLYNNKKWSNHSKYNQLEGGIMYVNTVPCIVTMFIPASFFYYKNVFSQFGLGGS
jgi:hypothetical protein